ncbi:fibronectin type III domain-containing protein [Streptomyces sp. ME02-6978a]|uniref:fibronectin type III domain-containing protein n=1 Tax=unclassified Streptomyces TaxID=2593676 RepID=UPI001F477526|nr:MULTISPECIES: carbohydrate binding domain-containing protein [unclassified Streptomyces]MCF0089711.1 Chitinase [Streptomyces sp. MH192]MCF0101788.1 Chitinase [Streptomyces sp. MH191]MDX3087044.1 fibronectin type III domain-containing protein [Streptomyces sp. ME12-02E]MDX3330559.1 fibronectin type III domain-containing protein [Streptomyces sp. ME02-6978a]
MRTRPPSGFLARSRRAFVAVLGSAALALAGALAVPGTAHAANVLSNPGFESGSLSPWSCSGNLGSVVSSPVHGGSRALAGAVTSADTAQCAQTVTVRPDTAYTLSGWVRGSYVYLGVDGGASTWASSPSAYTQLKVPFTTGASQTSVKLYVHGWYAQGTYYADDISLDGPGGGGGSDTQAPSAPANLTSTGKTSSSVSLSWSASSDNVGVTGYDVYSGGNQVLSVSGTSATVGGLSPSTAYTFTVKARDAAGNTSGSSNAVSVTTGAGGGGDTGAFKQAAPYLYLGWGDPPNAASVMSATGVKWYTMAFMLDSGGCNPAWDGNRPLTGGVDQSTINQIRSAGGDIVPSFGGWQGSKLGANCSSASALAGALQKVIDAYSLKAIDMDIENTDEFENEAVQARILTALKTVKADNPGLRTIVTFGTTTTGPTYYGNRLVEQAKSLDANIDVFTIMPFDFGGGSDMYGNTVNAAEGLKAKLKSTFGWDDATAYSHLGISGMNGLSDQQENTTPAIWSQIRDWSNSHHIARLAYWAVNRDRPCAGGGVVSNCSGISQSEWQFTSITAGFKG